EAFRESNGACVFGVYEAGQPRPLPISDRIVPNSRCGFESIALTPVLSGERPTELTFGPPERKVKTDSTHEVPRSILNCPHPEAPQRPMPHEHCQLAPCVVPGKRVSTQVAHDFRVCAHLSVGWCVVLAELAEEKTLRFNQRHVHKRSPCAGNVLMQRGLQVSLGLVGRELSDVSSSVEEAEEARRHHRSNRSAS